MMNQSQKIFYTDDGRNQVFFEVSSGLENGIPFGKVAKIPLNMQAPDQLAEMNRVIAEITRLTGVSVLSAALEEALNA